jgi:hypothetical protein
VETSDKPAVQVAGPTVTVAKVEFETAHKEAPQGEAGKPDAGPPQSDLAGRNPRSVFVVPHASLRNR